MTFRNRTLDWLNNVIRGCRLFSNLLLVICSSAVDVFDYNSQVVLKARSRTARSNERPYYDRVIGRGKNNGAGRAIEAAVDCYASVYTLIGCVIEDQWP